MSRGAHRAPRRIPRHRRPTDGVWWGGRMMAAIVLAAADAFVTGVVGQLAVSR